MRGRANHRIFSHISLRKSILKISLKRKRVEHFSLWLVPGERSNYLCLIFICSWTTGGSDVMGKIFPLMLGKLSTEFRDVAVTANIWKFLAKDLCLLCLFLFFFSNCELLSIMRTRVVHLWHLSVSRVVLSHGLLLNKWWFIYGWNLSVNWKSFNLTLSLGMDLIDYV